MSPLHFTAAAHEGIFCIACAQTDFNEPQIVRNLWPTTFTMREVLRYFFDAAAITEDNYTELLGQLSIVQSRPGEYFVGIKDSLVSCWRQGQHISLVNGAATQSVHTECKPVNPPKARKGALIYWSDGGWVKKSAKGKPERIYPSLE